jgi:hypothetical protein
LADFVNLDPRAAGWPMARPAAPVTPAVGVWPAAKANGESAARQQPAFVVPLPANPASGERQGQKTLDQPAGEPTDTRPSSPFTAQRLAQETVFSPEIVPLRTAATAAYLKTRDSHIQILRSIQALDLRV